MKWARISHLELLVGALVLLVLGAGGGYWWAHRTMVPGPAAHPPASSAPITDSSGAPEGKSRILYWHDPMKPEVKFDKPGKSPFMDMQLVPVYADQGSESGGVRVPPGVVQNLGIRLGKVESVRLKSGLHAVGSVVFDDRDRKSVV